MKISCNHGTTLNCQHSVRLFLCSDAQELPTWKHNVSFRTQLNGRMIISDTVSVEDCACVSLSVDVGVDCQKPVLEVGLLM